MSSSMEGQLVSSQDQNLVLALAACSNVKSILLWCVKQNFDVLRSHLTQDYFTVRCSIFHEIPATSRFVTHMNRTSPPLAKNSRTIHSNTFSTHLSQSFPRGVAGYHSHGRCVLDTNLQRASNSIIFYLAISPSFGRTCP